jgi:hypothetical protein
MKIVRVHGSSIKLFSVDGRLWVSKPSAIEKFQRRLDREKVTCQKWFHNYVRPGNGAVAVVDSPDPSCCEEAAEVRLWKNVIARALRDSAGDYSPCRHYEQATLRRRALAWIFSMCEDEGSFLWICRYLDLDPTIVRMQAGRSSAATVSPSTKRPTLCP